MSKFANLYGVGGCCSGGGGIVVSLGPYCSACGLTADPINFSFTLPTVTSSGTMTTPTFSGTMTFTTGSVTYTYGTIEYGGGGSEYGGPFSATFGPYSPGFWVSPLLTLPSELTCADGTVYTIDNQYVIYGNCESGWYMEYFNPIGSPCSGTVNLGWSEYINNLFPIQTLPFPYTYAATCDPFSLSINYGTGAGIPTLTTLVLSQ